MTVKINDKPWRELVNLVKKANGMRVRVGVFEGEIAKVATIHEFGAPRANIPERSYIRSTLREKRDELAQLQQRLTRLMLDRKITEQKYMQLLGAWLVQQVKQRIINQPPEWPARESRYDRRQRARGKTKILIDTGQLIASIIYKIVGR